mgnify:CR=1 FL=1
MAKVTAPFLSLSARGTVGGALTSSQWKGINTMRIKSNPSNPQTTSQMLNRGFLASAGKVTKVTNPLSSVAVTPAGQSYASFFIRQYLGTNNANIAAAKTAYNTVGNSAQKALFDTAAADISLESVDLDGTTNTQVPAGLALWAAMQAAYVLGSTDAAAPALTATETQIGDFATALSTAA